MKIKNTNNVKNVTVMGTGVYGLAIASALAKNDHIENIYMWTESKEKEKEWQDTKELKSIIPDFHVSEKIIVTKDIAKVLEKPDIIFITCASKYVKGLVKDMLPYYVSNTPICIASKGIDEESGNLLSNIVKKELSLKDVAVISGPTFAQDLLHNDPVALAIAGTNKTVRRFAKEVLENDTLKLRESSDLIGIQICGSVKNIIAIASGILGGLGYSESTQAFLINESLHDIKNLIRYLHGKPKTILSYAGVGDLLMTSMSKKSRNYSFGFVIGSTKDKEETQKFLDTHTVEGYHTLKTVINLLNEKSINIELIYLIDDIIKGNKKPESLAEFLINKK